MTDRPARIATPQPPGYPPWPVNTSSTEAALMTVLRSGHWWQSGGGQSERLERALGSDFGLDAGAVCVANGTVALEVALRALLLGPGDEVLVPCTTFVSTASAVVAVGARPVPVDVAYDGLNLDVEAAEAAMSASVRAVIVVHLAGRPADLEAARTFADSHGLWLIEDAAQAFRAVSRSRRVGTVGHASTLSFQAAKLLPGGDGGAVLVPTDGSLRDRVEVLANCGRPRGGFQYAHVVPSTNGRISEFAAAVVLAQLSMFDGYAETRSRNYRRVIEALPDDATMNPDVAIENEDHYMVLLRLPERARASGASNRELVDWLRQEGLPCQPLYPALNRIDGLRPHIRTVACPVSEEASESVVWLHHRLLLAPELPENLAAAWCHIFDATGAVRVRGS